MNEVIGFAKLWYDDGKVLLRRGDPLLMGAAIAFNSLFALVPLALAFVSVITLLDRSDVFLSEIVEWLDAALPPELASFVIGILEQSEKLVSSDRVTIFVISILVALWSGSRAVYAIQKSLRLVQGTVDERGYIRTRLTGIAVTIGAGVAVFLAYAAILIGESTWQQLTDWLGMPGVGITRFAALAVGIGWMFGLLYVIYRWGPPGPVPLPSVTAGIVSAVLSIGTALASVLLPSIDSAAVAVFGSIGVILLWLYFIGVVVVAVPVAVMSFLSSINRL
jgi:membrane protein